MKIAYVTEYDPHDVRQWSGLGTHILNALRGTGRAEVEAWRPLRQPRNPLHKVWKLVTQALTGQHCLSEREAFYGRHLARQIEATVRTRGADLIFSPGAVPLSYLDTDVPFAFWSDATLAGIMGFYDGFSNTVKRPSP